MSTTDYLQTKAARLGIEPEVVFQNMVQSEYAYGVTATGVAILVFWTMIYVFRLSYKQYTDSYDEGWIVGLIVPPFIAIIALCFGGNAVHHIMTPESYAVADLEFEISQLDDDDDD